MPIETTFIETPGVYIIWDNYEAPNLEEEEYEEKIDELIRKLAAITQKTQWKYDSDAEIIPISGTGDLRDWIKELKKIVKFLDDNNIPWAGHNVPFKGEDESGVLVIKKEIAIIVTIDEEGDTTKEIIPIRNPITDRKSVV